ncbi:kinase-like domain-containing protein [Trametes maxima]|nr:kinase-like domain-containing protein [Trametes maxima]
MTAVSTTGSLLPLRTASIIGMVTAGIAVTIFFSRMWAQIRPQSPEGDITKTRQKLPRTLEEWRYTNREEDVNPIWNALGVFLKARGYILWRHLRFTFLVPPDDSEVTCNGFSLAPVHRGWDMHSPMAELSRFDSPNALNRPARSTDGRDVVVRVICAGSEGQTHLEILKYISRGLASQATPNHAVPLLDVFQLEDVVVGVFPKVGRSLFYMYHPRYHNSVGDIVDMIMQCLEALGYMHSIGVAHRDAFRDNFLVQWFPESMAENQLTVSRPRVYLNDFETAVHFPDGDPSGDCTCVGLPLSPSFPTPERYFRPLAPELSFENPGPYSPFKLDIWQLGDSLRDLKTSIPEIDSVLIAMVEEDPCIRIDAFDALQRISDATQSIPPERLRILPVIVSESH